MKKLTLILAAAAIVAAAAIFIDLKFAAVLAAAIIFFSLIPRLLPLILEWQDKYEFYCWKKAIEEKQKIKERIEKICREVPQEHLA